MLKKFIGKLIINSIMSKEYKTLIIWQSTNEIYETAVPSRHDEDKTLLLPYHSPEIWHRFGQWTLSTDESIFLFVTVNVIGINVIRTRILWIQLSQTHSAMIIAQYIGVTVLGKIRLELSSGERTIRWSRLNFQVLGDQSLSTSRAHTFNKLINAQWARSVVVGIVLRLVRSIRRSGSLQTVVIAETWRGRRAAGRSDRTIVGLRTVRRRGRFTSWTDRFVVGLAVGRQWARAGRTGRRHGGLETARQPGLMARVQAAAEAQG